MHVNKSPQKAWSRPQAGHNDRRPLIEQVSNKWRDEKAGYTYGTEDDIGELRFCDLDNPNSCPNALLSRRFRKMLFYALLALLTVWYFWSKYVQPQLDDEWAYQEGFLNQENGTYGIAKGGDLDPEMVRLEHLDHALLPGGPSDPHGKRRLVFVGDVHGCKKELLKLLEKLDFNEKTDHLVLTGDVISKGPDNVGVLDELMRLGATSVRGNHEDRILHVAKSLELNQPLSQTTPSKGIAKDLAILKDLRKHHLEYLRQMPLMLHIPALPQALGPTSKKTSPISEHIFVVHAGLVPGVRLDKQDPYFVMNMRSINRRTHVPSAEREGKNAKPWFDIWMWYNERLFRQDVPLLSKLASSHGQSANWVGTFASTVFKDSKNPRLRPQQVVYGHDSKAGLQIKRWSKGLDSGCVNGDDLTAMVLNAKGEFDLHSVGCKNYRD